jgi:hypothetical protein
MIGAVKGNKLASYSLNCGLIALVFEFGSFTAADFRFGPKMT